MAFRRDLVEALSAQPRSVSSLARELGLGRRDVEDDLRHAIRSAQAAGHRVVVEPARCKQCGFVFGTDRLAKPGRCPGHRVVVEPARCKQCGFVFGTDRLAKPGRCPGCRGSRLYEAQIWIESS